MSNSWLGCRSRFFFWHVLVKVLRRRLRLRRVLRQKLRHGRFETDTQCGRLRRRRRLGSVLHVIQRGAPQRLRSDGEHGDRHLRLHGGQSLRAQLGRRLLLWRRRRRRRRPVRDALVHGVLRDAALHARRADLCQEVDATGRVSERLFIFRGHGILNCGRGDVAERGSSAGQVFSSARRRRRTASPNL